MEISDIRKHREAVRLQILNSFEPEELSKAEFSAKYPAGEYEIYDQAGISCFIKALNNACPEEIVKAQNDLSHLQKKVITDKLGHKTTRWVRSVKNEKDSKKLNFKSLPSQNNKQGFFGTIASKHDKREAEEIWPKVSKELHKKLIQKKLTSSPEIVRNLLDSVYGKHLANYVLDGYSVAESIDYCSNSIKWRKMIKNIK